MTRTQFLSQVSRGAVSAFLPICLGTLSGCQKANISPIAPSDVNFTIDVSSGGLSVNGGFLIKNGIVIARSNSGNFIAVSATCAHEGTKVEYDSQNNSFSCPSCGAAFNNKGQVTLGPSVKSLTGYRTILRGNLLTILSYT